MTELTKIYWILCIWLVLLQTEHSEVSQTERVKGREKETFFLGCSLIKSAFYNMQLKAMFVYKQPLILIPNHKSICKWWCRYHFSFEARS